MTINTENIAANTPKNIGNTDVKLFAIARNAKSEQTQANTNEINISNLLFLFIIFSLLQR